MAGVTASRAGRRKAGAPATDAGAPFGRLVLDAMEQKAGAEGRPVTYATIAAATGRERGLVHKWVTGARHPSREAVTELVASLAPHLNEDEALVLAGYAPGTLIAAVTTMVDTRREQAAAPADRMAADLEALGTDFEAGRAALGRWAGGLVRAIRGGRPTTQEAR